MRDELREREYRRVADELARAPYGPKLAIGCEPVLCREYLPEVKPLETAAGPLPLENGSAAALALFDVLERLPSLRAFFSEASRVLAPGGLLVLSEPYVGPMSYPLYKLGSEALIRMFADPLAHPTESAPGTNQASATLLFGPRRASFERTFPELRIDKVERTAGPEASGSGEATSSRPSMLVRRLAAVESRLPKAALSLFGFRMLAVLQKR
jgi:SAM-dependent methyltransferase